MRPVSWQSLVPDHQNSDAVAAHMTFMYSCTQSHIPGSRRAAAEGGACRLPCHACLRQRAEARFIQLVILTFTTLCEYTGMTVVDVMVKTRRPYLCTKTMRCVRLNTMRCRSSAAPQRLRAATQRGLFFNNKRAAQPWRVTCNIKADLRPYRNGRQRRAE